MSDGRAAPRSWMLWGVAVAGIGVLAGVLVLGLASSRLDQPGLRVRRAIARSPKAVRHPKRDRAGCAINEWVVVDLR